MSIWPECLVMAALNAGNPAAPWKDMDMRKTEIAWLAGLFDGEGSIKPHPQGFKKSKTWSVKMWLGVGIMAFVFLMTWLNCIRLTIENHRLRKRFNELAALVEKPK